MALFQNLIDFFQELFMPASPEVKKRIALRKLENEVRDYTPQIYKNDMLLPAARTWRGTTTSPSSS